MAGLDDILNEAGATKAVDEEKQEQQPEGNVEQQPEQKPNAEEQTNEGAQQEGQGAEEAQPQAEQEQEPKQEEQKQEVSEQDIISHLNASLNTNFKSLEDVKGLQSSQEKLSEYEAKMQEQQEALNSAGDPLKHFANEQLLKTNEILKKNENISLGIASKLATADFDNMSDDDVLAFNEVLQNPHYEGKESMIKEMIEEDYGLDVDPDGDEMDDRQKRKLERQKMRKETDARKVRESLKNMSNVEVPQKKDLQQEHQQKLEQFRPQAEKVLEEKMDSIKVGKDGYEYQIDGDFKQWLKDNDHLTRFLANNYDPNDASSLDDAVEKVKQIYVNRNIDKIVDDVVEQERARMRDQVHQETHNPKQNNRQEAPKMSDVEQKNKQEEDRLVQDARKM